MLRFYTFRWIVNKINPIVQEDGVDLKLFYLLEFVLMNVLGNHMLIFAAIKREFFQLYSTIYIIYIFLLCVQLESQNCRWV